VVEKPLAHKRLFKSAVAAAPPLAADDNRCCRDGGRSIGLEAA